jgi:hypothetical protein
MCWSTTTVTARTAPPAVDGGTVAENLDAQCEAAELAEK